MSLARALIIGSLVGLFFAIVNFFLLGIPGTAVGYEILPGIWNQFEYPGCGESCWGGSIFNGSILLFCLSLLFFVLAAALSKIVKDFRNP
ncbi:MAG: hypothetical protein Q7S29_03155 [Candidatus Peribacter sp.]|nr:hypothetical protein [Candidatus Peribacter sp.]